MVASAVASWLLAGCVGIAGFYAPVFFVLAVVVAILAAAALFVRLLRGLS